ncbi:hypothetical protein IFM89_023135 [Coptis chinensis]|uniref:Uncharacterized protein n=1 Tax=Coptis chinensis TaxID=261450 RepID=A0A835LV43_9MAGN|nr:hypothetical protein IFM89_023135 [Coptis chinensis]
MGVYSTGVTQTSLGACEDGIVTAELLEKLFMAQGAVVPNFHVSADQSRKEVFLFCKENAVGASVASVTEVLEIKQNVIKESEDAEFEASHQRVFLLGENRWEDSSRLVGRNKEVSASKVEFQQQSVLLFVGRGVYYAQNVMELVSQTSSRSEYFWNGLTREQNVHTVTALATTFAMYVKGKHLSVHD